jgi:hypothetical protein
MVSCYTINWTFYDAKLMSHSYTIMDTTLEIQRVFLLAKK